MEFNQLNWDLKNKKRVSSFEKLYHKDFEPYLNQDSRKQTLRRVQETPPDISTLIQRIKVGLRDNFRRCQQRNLKRAEKGAYVKSNLQILRHLLLYQISI